MVDVEQTKQPRTSPKIKIKQVTMNMDFLPK